MSTMVATQSELALQPEFPPGIEVTPEDLLAMSDGGHYELVDGALKERSVSLLSSRVAVRLVRKLETYCEEHKLGWVVDSECGYRCFSWKPRQVRRADLSFISQNRIPSKEHWSDGYVTIPPDLAVEVVSPNDVARTLHEKVQEYLRAGVKLVWVITPETRSALVIRIDKSGTWLEVGDELTGEDVIPGFRCRLGDLIPEEAEDSSNSEPAPEAGHP
ncbi:MAG: Uma2 family endonuclease [Isosphaeraceae bacterium]